MGLYEKEAQALGIPVLACQLELADNDRAILDGETTGFLKLLVRAGTDEILGATLMARHAGEMISEIAVAIAGKTGLAALVQAIHPFPTQAETIRIAAETMYKMMSAKRKRVA